MYKFFSIVLIVILFLYNLLGIGIANYQIFSIPVLQLSALIICINFFYKFNGVISQIFSRQFWFILLIFMIYIFAIFIKSMSNGYPLIRIIQDAEIFYDIIFIFGGIGVAKIISNKTQLKILSTIFLSMAAWYLIIIIVGQELIQLVSPKIGGVYRSLSLFGAYPSHSFLMLGVPFFLFVQKNNLKNKFLAFFIGVTTLLAQKRFIFVEAIIISIFYHKKIAMKFFQNLFVIIPLIILTMYTFEFLEIRTSKGNIFSIDLITSTWQSAFVQNEESGGVSWRFNLYEDSLSKIKNINDMLFGLGFGGSLTDLTDTSTGLIIRTPHVYILTVFLRSGLIGLLFTLYFFSNFFSKGIKICFASKNELSKKYNYFLLLSFVIAFFEAQTNPMLEYAHMAFPRYFLIGLLLGQKN